MNVLGLLILLLSCVAVQGASFTELLKNNCIECHSDEKREGDLSLEVFRTKESFYVHYETLKQVYHSVKIEDMPPEDKPISTADRAALLGFMKSTIDRLESTNSVVGPTRARRLVGYEYDNTVEVLTGLDLKLSENFPSDSGGGEGFQNDSAILGVSALQFEKYLEAAEEISSYSRFDLKKGFTFSRSQAMPETKKDAINKIEKEIEKLLARLYPRRFSIEKFLPKLMEGVNEFNKGGRKPALFSGISKKYSISPFFLKRGIDYFGTSYGKGIIERDAIKPWFGLKQFKFDEKKAAKFAKDFTVEYKKALGQIDTVKEIKKKSYLDFKNNIKAIFTFTEAELLKLIDKSKIAEYQKLKMTLDFLENGMRSKNRGIFAKQLIPHIRSLMYKAHRMPPEEKEVVAMTKDFIEATSRYGIDVAARMFTIRTFASMKFIFRAERKLGKVSKINDYELASRLSYFLWGYPPDEELLKLASENKLNQPKILESQVMRMLKNKKSSSMAKYFAAQWLTFGEILEAEGPSPEMFPTFNEELAKDMYLESAICFEYIVKNDRSVLEIIDADYTFLNSRLRRHYGLGGGSSGFSKVTLRDKRRGGITSHASILTLTSNPQRTSPILRGNWIITSLLGTPSPPPPANVPALPDNNIVTENLTLKEQLEDHVKLPQCKSCHQRIDPMGFPLENFDPIGRWRKRYSNASIDAVGDLIDGNKINGPIELKQFLLKRKDDYLKNMSRKLLAYALGRTVYYYDYGLINKMVNSAKKNEYRFSSLVKEIVSSHQFQHKN